MYVSKVYLASVDSYGDVRTLVRGLPYQCPDDWEEVMESLDENSNLYLIKESDNPKDKHAIAAYLDDRRVGYVASSDCGKIWLYLTDEQMPCKFIQRYDASFKISFENPRSQFENIPFKEIYRDTFGISEQPNPAFEIPFLNNPKDDHYIWFDDKILIGDFEGAIPDFRRKLATRMIIFAGRKNSKGEYCYYLPFCNRPIADIEDGAVKNLVDKYGFVIALPDVPMITQQDIILMDLHVTYLSKTNYKEFDLANQSELVFSLTKDYDANFQMTAENQANACNDKNHNVIQDVVIDENDMFMQDSHSTPSYSKSDYILKKGEVTTSTIDKSTFIKIDKITTDLFEFVRQTLFPSTELFSYLKKHTPYYDQFYDFGQFETLIRVFVIKDLGRIYKGLKHSYNFDTKEGKPLFLYMDKEVEETTEISYELFAQICDSKSQLEAAIKMRNVIENFMQSFYEYDIVLWTDTDFIIHSFLKEINNEWAKRYMELMRQFASVVCNTYGITKDMDTKITKNNLTESTMTEELSKGKLSHEDFDQMDKLTTELDDFVRDNLIQSRRVLKQMHKHPHYGYRYDDLKDYVMFIKIFVMKDLCHIYKKLKCSLSIKDNEGKILFLYAIKALGNNTLSFETFEELCNPDSSIKTIIEYREMIENFVKQRYEEELPYYPNNSFLMQDVLEDENIDMMDLALEYKELMCRIESAVANAKAR